jgi:hypothetical protein
VNYLNKMARKTKNEDIMDSISYSKDVLKSDGGSMGDILVKITGATLGQRIGGGITNTCVKSEDYYRARLQKL